jgi:microtubule-associated protein-like 6
MKYSPDGAYLAVGSNDNFVDIYSVAQRYKRVGQCSGSSSFITHLDFSQDSKYIQTNSGAAERLFYKMPAGKRVTNKDEVKAIHWATWTCVLGQEVNGIWEKYTDTNDINAVDVVFDQEAIATGDDFGLVKLFRFPCVKKGAQFRKYVGHSAHVTNVKFSHGKRRLLSTGGSDHAVFQWQFFPEGNPTEDNAGMGDSANEESDSDLSDVPEVDSDVEQEQQVKYDRAVYKEDLMALKTKLSDTQKDQNSQASSNQRVKRHNAPTRSLRLEFVHGYRGYDCRSNLFYISTGDIVYHVAAVGIVYTKSSHTQRHYLGHTDDILCLALHPTRDLVATGQVGRDASVHVWEAENMQAVSILKGGISRGVCAVDFSSDGRHLASVGLDDNHTIVVWDWKNGQKLAEARGHQDKIFVIRWNPKLSNQLVTVGIKHIKFWTQTGGGFTSKRGTFGDAGKLDTMMGVTFSQDGHLTLSAGANGMVYIWNGTILAGTVNAHTGPVFAIQTVEKGYVTGGKDGTVSLWDDSFKQCLKSFKVQRTALAADSPSLLYADFPPIRSISLGQGLILVGTKNGEILEINKTGSMTLLTQV